MKNTNKKNIITVIVVIIASFVSTFAYGIYAYNDEAKKRGYKYNKETKRYEKTVTGLTQHIGSCLDEMSIQAATEERIQKFSICVTIISFVIGFVKGLKKNR